MYKWCYHIEERERERERERETVYKTVEMLVIIFSIRLCFVLVLYHMFSSLICVVFFLNFRGFLSIRIIRYRILTLF